MSWLFESSTFFTRSQCGTGWDTSTTLLNIVPNLIIFVCYLAIPLILIYARSWSSLKKEAFNLLPRWTFLAFASFIVSCGVGHLWDITVFWWAPYRFYGLWDSLTALSSAATLVGMLVWIKRIAQRWEEQEEEKEELKRMFRVVTEANEELARQLRKGEVYDPPGG